MQYFNFDNHQVSRIFKGNWQLAGGHGSIEREQAIDDLFIFVEHGVNAFDAGDIYTGAEEILGDFLARYCQKYGQDEAKKLRMHTKFVPDLNALEDLTKRDIRTIIERSLKRYRLDSLHLVQFHWWDFDKGDFVQAASYLDELRQEGLIETIGLTNTDCEHTKQLLDAGIPIVSNQVQFSLLDPRPLNGMLEMAQEHDMAIFCYGVLSGGLLAAKEPAIDPSNRSHVKYGLMIDEAGQDYYHLILKRINDLAKKYDTNAANIATKFVLQTPGVSSAILGPRNTRHISDLDQLDTFDLSEAEYTSLRREIDKLQITDDIYSYERDWDGPHAKIMKYNLNGMRPDRT